MLLPAGDPSSPVFPPSEERPEADANANGLVSPLQPPDSGAALAHCDLGISPSATVIVASSDA